MTKEDLLKEAFTQNNGIEVIEVEDIVEFFESNICIPKGENRHPYADVLHEWIEGVLIQYQDVCDDTFNELAHSISLHCAKSYRIKPSEPIYEWQWYWLDDGFKHISNQKMTEDEANNFHISKNWLFKDEETKQERK